LANQTPSIAKSIKKQPRLIAEFSFFIAVTVVIIILNGKVTNEALLLTVLIFGIYLILSGRITQFTFKDFEIKLKDTVSKPLEILTETFSEISETFEQTKGTEEELESQIIPKLSKEIPDKLSKEVQNSNEKRE
jgi:ABC-type bacteriocin/lantibiotic exporter with double-glycine peptidase domain